MTPREQAYNDGLIETLKKSAISMPDFSKASPAISDLASGVKGWYNRGSPLQDIPGGIGDYTQKHPFATLATTLPLAMLIGGLIQKKREKDRRQGALERKMFPRGGFDNGPLFGMA